MLAQDPWAEVFQLMKVEVLVGVLQTGLGVEVEPWDKEQVLVQQVQLQVQAEEEVVQLDMVDSCQKPFF